MTPLTRHAAPPKSGACRKERGCHAGKESEGVMPDLIRHPAAACERPPAWIAGRARNDTIDAACHAPKRLMPEKQRVSCLKERGCHAGKESEGVMPDLIRHPAAACEQPPGLDCGSS